MGEAALKSHNAHMIGKKRVDLDKIKIKDVIGTMKAFLGRPSTGPRRKEFWLTLSRSTKLPISLPRKQKELDTFL